MNKEGKIVLVDSQEHNRSFLCDCLKKIGGKNEVITFGDAESAGIFIENNVPEIFLLLQSTDFPRIQVPEARNMVYMHEKFNTPSIPYMFLVNTNINSKRRLEAFVHCYYRPNNITLLSELLCEVVLFWKDHLFPPKIQHGD